MPCGRCLSSARCIFYYPHPLLVSAFYVAQLAIVLVLSLSPSRGITQPEAFCAGTTAAYRKGNGSNSALTPSITLHLLGCPCTRRCARHALGVARRLRRVPWLRHLLRQQLGQRAERCRGVSRVWHNLDPCDHAVSTWQHGPHRQEAHRRPQHIVEGTLVGRAPYASCRRCPRGPAPLSHCGGASATSHRQRGEWLTLCLPYYCTLAPSPPLPNPFSRYSFTRWPRRTRFAATTWWR